MIVCVIYPIKKIKNNRLDVGLVVEKNKEKKVVGHGIMKGLWWKGKK